MGNARAETISETTAVFTSPAGEARSMAAYAAALAQWPRPYDELDIPTRLGATHVLASGPAGAPPLLLLHGQDASATSWIYNIADFCQAFRTFAVDTLGDFGKSKPVRLPNSRADYAAWLLDVLDQLEIAQIDLLGLSYGGFLALNFALAAPERVRHLALLAPGVPNLGAPTVKWAWYGMPMLAWPSRLTVKRFLNGASTKGYSRVDPVHEQMIIGMRTMRTRTFMRPVLTDAELKQLTVPTLLLIGDHEIMYAPHQALANAARLIPNLEAELIPQAGHLLNSDQPALVDERVVRFFTRGSATSAASAREEGASMQTIAHNLEGPFDFSMSRKPEIQYFRMHTTFVHLGFDGKRIGTETYLLRLRCVPAASSGKTLDHYTCWEFGLQVDQERLVSIPALKLWDYYFDPMSGADGKGGPVFGIPHDRFEDLTDSLGNRLAPDICYAIYNNFIDFHMFNDIFSRPMFGKGIAELKWIGDRIVHPAAFTEAPVNVGTAVKQGSVFRNGEIALEFKGVSVVDGFLCALIGYDSGESTLRMISGSSQGDDIVTEGGSEYKGDMFIDLDTGVVRKGTLDEFVVTEVGAANASIKAHHYTVRHLLLRLINQQEFETG